MSPFRSSRSCNGLVSGGSPSAGSNVLQLPTLGSNRTTHESDAAYQRTPIRSTNTGVGLKRRGVPVVLGYRRHFVPSKLQNLAESALMNHKTTLGSDTGLTTHSATLTAERE